MQRRPKRVAPYCMSQFSTLFLLLSGFYFSNGNNHAVLVVGYGPGYFLVKNSWGSRWGEDGFFKIKSGVGLCGFGWQLNSVPLC